MLAEVVSNEKPYLTRPLLKPKKKPKASPASNPHFVENLYPTMPFFFFFDTIHRRSRNNIRVITKCWIKPTVVDRHIKITLA